MRWPVALLLVVACKKPPPSEPAPIDAAAVGNVPPLRAVAEGPSYVTLHVTSDHRIVLLAGSLPFEARPDGTIAPIVPASVFAMPETSEPGVGAFVRTPTFKGLSGDVEHALFLASDDTTLVLQDRALHPTGTAVTNVVAWRDGFVGLDASGTPVTVGGGMVSPRLPPNVTSVRELATTSDGRLVALHESSRTIAIVWKTPLEPVIVTTNSSCRFLPAFDGSLVIACGYGAQWEVLRFAGNAFVPAYGELPDRAVPGSVSKEGALYAAASPQGLEVLRCFGGACSSMVPPIALGTADMATYDQYEQSPYDAGAGRQWASLGVRRIESEGPLASVKQVIARSVDDVWLLTEASRRSLLLHTGGPSARQQLPSVFDRDVLARNERAPAIATDAPCQRVFVRLGADGDAVAKRYAEIRERIGSEPGNIARDDFGWWPVAGTLHGEAVAGVVFAQSDAHRSPKAMNAMARALVASEKDAASPAAVFCTLPVLGRLLIPRSGDAR